MNSKSRHREKIRCLQANCKELAGCLGFCQLHYQKFRREEPQRYEWLRSLSGERRRFEIDRMRAAEREREREFASKRGNMPKWSWEGDEDTLAAQYGGRQDSK